MSNKEEAAVQPDQEPARQCVPTDRERKRPRRAPFPLPVFIMPYQGS